MTNMNLLKPQERITLKTSSEQKSLYHAQSKTVSAMVSLKGMKVDDKELESNRAPVHIACVIDKSESMRGDKLQLVKATLSFMVDQFTVRDRMSLIVFGDTVETCFSMVQMDDNARETAKTQIGNIEARGSTFLSGALEAGFNEVNKHFQPEAVSAIMLFTDGMANKGETNIDRLNHLVNSKISKLTAPCSLFTFGFGSDHDANTLRSISEISNGLYYYLSSTESIVDSFADCLGGLLSVVAKNIRMRIRFMENAKLANMLSHVKSTVGNQQVIVSLGDLYSEEGRDILFDVHVAPHQVSTCHELCQIELSYDSVLDGNRTVIQHNTISIQRTPRQPLEVTFNTAIDKQRSRILCANALAQARTLADQSRFTEARNILALAVTKIKGSRSGTDTFCTGLVDDLNACLGSIADKTSYNTLGSKLINNYYMSSAQQRSTNTRSAAQASYANAHKTKMQDMARDFVPRYGGRSAPFIVRPPSPISASMINSVPFTPPSYGGRAWVSYTPPTGPVTTGHYRPPNTTPQPITTTQPVIPYNASAITNMFMYATHAIVHHHNPSIPSTLQESLLQSAIQMKGVDASELSLLVIASNSSTTSNAIISTAKVAEDLKLNEKSLKHWDILTTSPDKVEQMATKWLQFHNKK